MRELKHKKLNNKELDNVNGGMDGGNYIIECPKCHYKFYCYSSQVTYGSGCDKEIYWKCPDCGHEWQ